MKRLILLFSAATLFITTFGMGAARAQQDAPPPPAAQSPAPTPPKPSIPYELGLQVTVIDQQLFKFHSPYQGPHSFDSADENEKSDTYTLYLGLKPTPRFELYVNPEMARGKGLSTTFGLAGYANGDVIRNPDLGAQPYLARYFGRWTFSTGRGEEKVAAGENQIEGTRPTHRLVWSLGKMGTPDIFDANSYANNTRTQFMNWALINSAAYDYAADTRGYTLGTALEWINPDWALRYGLFRMPTVANGPQLATNMNYNRGEQIELELHPRVIRHKAPAVVRILAYRNLAHAGNYRAALALAEETGTTPDITKVETRGNVKWGGGLNIEQPLADDGATGLFGRFGWDDGATESFAYTECDRTMCLGFQISGRRWGRPNDRIALAVVQNDLSAAHKDYLAAGGLGFILGDGRLNYAPERILETYYSYQALRHLALSLDYQFIADPGYNADRGPVSVVSLRAHLEF